MNKPALRRQVETFFCNCCLRRPRMNNSKICSVCYEKMLRGNEEARLRLKHHRLLAASVRE